jgi:hypothetical protein
MEIVMKLKTSAPRVGALRRRSIEQFEVRRVPESWAGIDRDLLVVKAQFHVREDGVWSLVTEPCPYCGEVEQHGFGINADWSASDNSNPIRYAATPKHAHCKGNRHQHIYVNQIVSGLPAEALDSAGER